MAGNNIIYSSSGSKYPVSFVEIIFAVVLGSSILKFSDILFPPTLTSPNFWALTIAYINAITSWFGWHKSTNIYPYTPSKKGSFRSVLDGIIVVVYVALLFFGSEADKYILFYLWSFAVVFSLYIIVGLIRRAEYKDSQASHIKILIWHLVAVFVIAASYLVFVSIYPQFKDTVVLWIYTFLPLFVIISFRWIRGSVNKPAIAIDLDGVLVEQVLPVLDKLKKETGVTLNKSDITDWQFPIGNTDIKTEIEKAEENESFVREMSPIKDGTRSTQILSRKYDITIATSRDPVNNPWSIDWLAKHNIEYKHFVNTRSEGKILNGVNILIDDYIGNIQDFMRNGDRNRKAILFAQPWNEDTSAITDLISSGRAKIAHSWQAVLSMLG